MLKKHNQNKWRWRSGLHYHSVAALGEVSPGEVSLGEVSPEDAGSDCTAPALTPIAAYIMGAAVAFVEVMFLTLETDFIEHG